MSTNNNKIDESILRADNFPTFEGAVPLCHDLVRCLGVNSSILHILRLPDGGQYTGLYILLNHSNNLSSKQKDGIIAKITKEANPYIAYMLLRNISLTEEQRLLLIPKLNRKLAESAPNDIDGKNPPSIRVLSEIERQAIFALLLEEELMMD